MDKRKTAIVGGIVGAISGALSGVLLEALRGKTIRPALIVVSAVAVIAVIAVIVWGIVRAARSNE